MAAAAAAEMVSQPWPGPPCRRARRAGRLRWSCFIARPAGPAPWATLGISPLSCPAICVPGRASRRERGEEGYLAGNLVVRWQESRAGCTELIKPSGNSAPAALKSLRSPMHSAFVFMTVPGEMNAARRQDRSSAGRF